MKFVAFCIWCIALSFLFLETTLRVITPPDTLKVHWLSGTHYEFYPNYEGTFYSTRYHIDSQGFRFTANNQQGINSSLLLLGDSMIFGSGVEDKNTIASYLAKKISGAHIPLKVINGGVPSYSTIDYFLRLQRALELLPQNQIVVCGIFSKNDFEEFLITKNKEKKKILNTLKNNSRAFALFYSLLEGKNRLEQIEQIKISHEILVGESNFAKNTITDALSYLPKMKEIAKTKNNEIVFLYIPYAAQVSQEVNAYYQKIKAKPGLPPKVTGDLLRHGTRDIFLQFCKTHSINCLDLTELFEHSPYALTHYPGQKTKEVLIDAATGHFSEEGSQLIADFLFEKLENYFESIKQASS